MTKTTQATSSNMPNFEESIADSIELNRQYKMAWKRGNQIGMVEGAIIMLFIGAIIKIIW